MRTGDTLDVWRLDWFRWSLGQLMALMQTLQSRQIRFHNLAKAIDPDTLAMALQLFHAETSSVQRGLHLSMNTSDRKWPNFQRIVAIPLSQCRPFGVVGWRCPW